MRAAVLREPRDLRVEVAPDPVPAPDEVVVRVKAAGLCGTDFRIWNGDRPVRYPLIMGHEFLGEIAGVGVGASRFRVGQRVAVEPNYGCGVCDLCREGNRNLCLKRTAIGIDVPGGFAELAVVPEHCCWPIPDGVADEEALLVEPLAVVVRAVERGHTRADEWAGVVGGGTLGLLALQVLRARGCRVLLVSRTDRRFALARDLGADAVALSEEVQASRTLSGRDGMDVVIETAGTPQAVQIAVDLARPSGRVVLTGLPHSPSEVNFFWVVRRELQLLGSMIYQEEFETALELLATGRVRTKPLITHRFALDALGDAFQTHQAPGAIKVAIFPSR